MPINHSLWPRSIQKLLDKFKVPELRDTEGMFVHEALDRMVQTQGWLCPIQADQRVDGAYYSPLQDKVVLPMKAQFNTGTTPEEIYRDSMEYYSTMLHEMTHSTMATASSAIPSTPRMNSWRNSRRR